MTHLFDPNEDLLISITWPESGPEVNPTIEPEVETIAAPASWVLGCLLQEDFDELRGGGAVPWNDVKPDVEEWIQGGGELIEATTENLLPIVCGEHGLAVTPIADRER